jgi:hypothetical protein
MSRFFRTTLLAALLAVALLAPSASACPMCKDTVANSPAAADGTGGGTNALGNQPSSLPGGFNASIYFMLTAFLGVLGFVGFTLYRAARQTAPRPGFPVAAAQAAQAAGNP